MKDAGPEPGRNLQSLLVEHLPQLEAFVRLRTGKRILKRESISDVVQSICVEVTARAESFRYRGDPEFRAYLFRHAAHRIANKGKYHARDCRNTDQEVAQVEADQLAACYAGIATPSVVMAGKEAVAAFEAAFEKLPDDYREAITMKRIAGLSYEEIALEMDRSVGAVRNLVSRGLARLVMALDDQNSAADRRS